MLHDNNIKVNVKDAELVHYWRHMYPKIYLDYFRDFEGTAEVFVAMPFSDEFQPRWKNIIVPAITEVNLEPCRVDVRKISDSILIDILDGIGRSKLVLVDTSFQQQNDRPAGPNANVMYELGIAQAVRLPEEVIVIRDNKCKDSSPFDIGHIRYNPYDVDDPDKAQSTIRELLIEAQKAVDKTRDIIVHRILRSLDPDRMWFMGTIGGMDTFDLNPFDQDRKGLYQLGYRDSSEDELRHVARDLIDLSLLKGEDAGPLEKRVYGATPEYRVTSLGKAVWANLPKWCKQDL